MHFGVYLSGIGVCSDPNVLTELAHEAEETDWDGVFIWHHIGQPNWSRRLGMPRRARLGGLRIYRRSGLVSMKPAPDFTEVSLQRAPQLAPAELSQRGSRPRSTGPRPETPPDSR